MLNCWCINLSRIWHEIWLKSLCVCILNCMVRSLVWILLVEVKLLTFRHISRISGTLFGHLCHPKLKYTKIHIHNTHATPQTSTQIVDIIPNNDHIVPIQPAIMCVPVHPSSAFFIQHYDVMFIFYFLFGQHIQIARSTIETRMPRCVSVSDVRLSAVCIFESENFEYTKKCTVVPAESAAICQIRNCHWIRTRSKNQFKSAIEQIGVERFHLSEAI